MPVIPHFDKIDKASIRARFFDDRRHRASLHLPFQGATSRRTLCVIGQNPSAADERGADKTIRYLEELIYRTGRYGGLMMLNLYSRVDTTKLHGDVLLHPRCAAIFDAELGAGEDFLVVFGRVKNEGAYRFLDRALEVADRLGSKNVMKLGLSPETAYAPHPGNPKILYRAFDVNMVTHDFSDIRKRAVTG